MQITIEPAVAGDIGAMAELLNILFSIEQDFVPNEAAQRRGLALLLAHPERARAFVARDQSKPNASVVGMVSAQLVISTAMGTPSAWIEDLVIREPYRRHGVGKALLDKARDWAYEQGARRIQLLADADNPPALAVYQHLNWQPTRLFAWKKLLS